MLSSTSNRNTLYEKLVGLPEVTLEQVELEELTHKWQLGELSNYDYLMYLNLSVQSPSRQTGFHDLFVYVIAWPIGVSLM